MLYRVTFQWKKKERGELLMLSHPLHRQILPSPASYMVSTQLILAYRWWACGHYGRFRGIRTDPDYWRLILHQSILKPWSNRSCHLFYGTRCSSLHIYVVGYTLLLLGGKYWYKFVSICIDTIIYCNSIYPNNWGHESLMTIFSRKQFRVVNCIHY